MKDVIIFTHGIDIDGFGCAILGKIAYPNAEIVFADNFDLDEKMQKYGDFENFDKIFVTDHCPSLAFCKKLEENPSILSKIKIFDHHASRLNEQGLLPWINIIVDGEKGKTCGTELFYNYLTQQNLIKKTKALDDFVELTRLYDTWEWVKDSENGNSAYRLNTLFQAYGREKYIETIQRNLANNTILTSENEKDIDEYLYEYNEQIKNYISSLKIINFNGDRVGCVEIYDLFKNDIANSIREDNNPEQLDYLLMPLIDRNSVSLRSIKKDFDVSKIAAIYGGGGHTAAASFPKENFPQELKSATLKDKV